MEMTGTTTALRSKSDFLPEELRRKGRHEERGKGRDESKRSKRSRAPGSLLSRIHMTSKLTFLPSFLSVLGSVFLETILEPLLLPLLGELLFVRDVEVYSRSLTSFVLHVPLLPSSSSDKPWDSDNKCCKNKCSSTGESSYLHSRLSRSNELKLTSLECVLFPFSLRVLVCCQERLSSQHSSRFV